MLAGVENEVQLRVGALFRTARVAKALGACSVIGARTQQGMQHGLAVEARHRICGVPATTAGSAAAAIVCNGLVIAAVTSIVVGFG